MRIGIASDHGGFALKSEISAALRAWGHEVRDFGDAALDPSDDYPDFVAPLARAVAADKVERGIALCGSGVGASIAANKIARVRAGLIHDVFSARQGVEDDDMNVICMGGRVVGGGLALQLVETFLAARFSGAERHRRRLAKVRALETPNTDNQANAQRRNSMIEQLPNFPDNVLAFRCKGRVTKADYDSVLVPVVEKALATHRRIRLYYETAADFAGIDPGAVWEDFTVGMEHLTRWERFAIVTDVEWITHTMKLFSFLMPGVMKFYSTSESEQARAWIVAAS